MKSPRCHLPGLANRHGLITGATGTGKTITMQALAQRLSDLGVPVFMADVKGDLSGMAKPAVQCQGPRAFPVVETQARVRRLPGRVLGYLRQERAAGACDGVGYGPLLLGRMLGLNETQEGVLGLVFKIADDNGLCFSI